MSGKSSFSDPLFPEPADYMDQTELDQGDEPVIDLQQLDTRNTAVSRSSYATRSSLYRETSRIDMEGDDNMPSGMEFEKEDPNLVTWDSDDDPENPRNWTSTRKVVITALVSFQTLIPTFASSIISPAVPEILSHFHNSNRTVGSLVVSIMVLSWSFSALLWAPLSETIGRRKVLIISGFFHTAFSIGCAESPNIAGMIVFRALCGWFNSAALAMGGATLADIYDDEQRQWPIAIWSLAPGCGPAIAPVIGGWIAEKTTWRWGFWTIVILQGTVLALLVVFMNETYPQTILSRKKKIMQKESGNSGLHTIWDLNTITIAKRIKLVILRPILFLTLNPVVFLLASYLAMMYGFMYLIINDFPSLWTDKYHYSQGIGGLMYLGYAIGMVSGSFVWTTLINSRYKRNQQLGRDRLEDRLFFLPISTFVLAGGMFWYGWSAQAKLPWPMPTVGIGIFSFALFCVFQSVQTYVVSLNARFAGSAIAACVFLRSLLGGTFPLFGRAMYQNLGYGWASTIVALLALVLGVPWPIGIYIYGARLRKWVDDNIYIE